MIASLESCRVHKKGGGAERRNYEHALIELVPHHSCMSSGSVLLGKVFYYDCGPGHMGLTMSWVRDNVDHEKYV